MMALGDLSEEPVTRGRIADKPFSGPYTLVSRVYEGI
jgi:hypothetical protein